MRSKIKTANKKWDNPETDALVRTLFLLRGEDEIRNFLRDLLTESELIEFGHRLKAAMMLSKGIHYNAIAEQTGLSSATIARVQKWRKEGAGGYRKVLSVLQNGK